jgi:hypothetical protein
MNLLLNSSALNVIDRLIVSATPMAVITAFGLHSHFSWQQFRVQVGQKVELDIGELNKIDYLS